MAGTKIWRSGGVGGRNGRTRTGGGGNNVSKVWNLEGMKVLVARRRAFQSNVLEVGVVCV